MADTVSVKYLHPTDMLDGQWDDKPGNRRVIVQLRCTSDGTGETDALKVDLSDLKTTEGQVPTRTAVEWIQYSIFGLTIVLEWERTPHAEIIRLNGNGVELDGRINWTQFAGNVDPGTDDSTGDIILTSTNADAGDSYDITMCIRLK